MTEPFEESRRLTGCNAYFAGTGAALEAARGLAFDQAALDEAARQGFANGAFEELEEDVPAVVEEFFPEATVTPGPTAVPSGLKGKLEAKVGQLPQESAA